MELFSELYSAYYHVVNIILKRAKNGMTEKEMIRQIESEAYGESSIFIMPKLTSGQWKLLSKRDGLYYSDKVNGISGKLTTLQLSYIKALLGDERIGLFLTQDEKREVEELLEEYPALFQCEDFRYYDQYRDGDDYEQITYQKVFSRLTKAIKENRFVKIVYGEKQEAQIFVPVNLEYSVKNDKFRLAAIRVIKGSYKGAYYLLLNKMKQVEVQKESYGETDIEDIFSKRIERDWVEFEIYQERNALERVTLHFSNYEKHIEYNEEKECWICCMYYDRNDKLEILVSLLSFGPVIKVVGPQHFVDMIKIRLYKQRKLLN